MERNLSQKHLCLTLARLTTARLLRRKSSWFMLAVGLLPCLVGGLWILNQVVPDMRLTILPYTMFNSYQSLFMLILYLPLVSIFLGLGTVNDEIESKNITFTTVRPLSPVSIALGRFLGHLGAAATLLTVSMVGNYFVNMFFQFELFFEKLPNLLNGLFMLCCGLTAYLGLIAALGTWSKKFAIMGSVLFLVLDALFAMVPVDAIKGLSIKYKIMAGYWETLPQYTLSGTVEHASAALNGLILLVIGLAGCGLIAYRLHAVEIVLTDSAG